MVEEAVFTPAQTIIINIVAEAPGLSVNEIGRRAGIPGGTAVDRVDRLESRGRFKSLKSRKRGDPEGRRVYLIEDYPAEETKRVLLTEPETKARLMKKFSLDELDVRLLEQVKGDESFQELAGKFKVVANQMQARIERSIPAKFDKTFPEAQAIFLELMKEALALQVA